MKIIQTIIICVSIFISAAVIMHQIEQRVDVHWLVPRHADCAIKMMYLRVPTPDGDSKLMPSSRMVCHWRVD